MYYVRKAVEKLRGCVEFSPTDGFDLQRGGTQKHHGIGGGVKVREQNLLNVRERNLEIQTIDSAIKSFRAISNKSLEQ